MNARSRLDMGLQRLVKKYPFHAAVLSKMHIIGDESIQTMAVSITKREEKDLEEVRVNLIYSPSFTLKLSLAELVGVLLHEVHHVIFGHLFMKQEEFPDRRALVIAQEVTVNEFVREPLPLIDGKECIFLKHYPELAPHTSTQERYKKLARPSSDKKGNPKVHDNPVHNSQNPQTVDNHDAWVVEVDEELAKEFIEQLLEDAKNKAGGMPQTLEEASTQHGIVPGGFNEGVHHRQGKIPWPVKLRRYVGSVLEVRPVYNRPNRRLPHLLGIVPGRSRRSGKPHILAAYDTSGSIFTELAIMINSELRKLARDFKVTVVECDAAIQKVYPYKDIQEISGRGGTDFRPVLDKSFLKKVKPDLVIYFTDGYGPAPKEAPSVPLIWCVTPHGQVPAPYGKVIQMN